MTQIPDRSSIMQKAWKQWRYARSRGWDKIEDADQWTWPRCLCFAQAQARARRPDDFSALEVAMRNVLVASSAPFRLKRPSDDHQLSSVHSTCVQEFRWTRRNPRFGLTLLRQFQQAPPRLRAEL